MFKFIIFFRQQKALHKSIRTHLAVLQETGQRVQRLKICIHLPLDIDLILFGFTLHMFCQRRLQNISQIVGSHRSGCQDPGADQRHNNSDPSYPSP